jgi:exopolysaccharide biosynthesis polyprenyl glycosylphosphotransferase
VSELLESSRPTQLHAVTDAPPREAQAPQRLQRVLGRSHVRQLVTDCAILLFAMAAVALSAGLADVQQTPIGWSLAFVAVALIALAANGAYDRRFSIQFLEDLRAVLGATAIAAMGVTFVRVVVSDAPEIASQEVRAWMFAATYLAAGRAGARLVQASARRQGVGAARTLIFGAGMVGHRVATRLNERPEFGLEPVAFFDADPLEVKDGIELPVLTRAPGQSPADRIEEIVHELGIEELIVTFSLAKHDQELDVVRRCLELGVGVSLIPRLFEGVPDKTLLERIGGIPLITVQPSDPRGWQFELKYVLDRVLGLLALIFALPFLLFAAIGTFFTLGRPLLFRQPRVGIDGRDFDILKFRTMRPDPGGPDDSLLDDLERGLAPGGVEGQDRRTRFGAFLRRTSLDELPQLLNVLRGEMSLIGPRPERPEFSTRFGVEVHRYNDRLRVKSGITGWAQVHGLRGRTSIADRIEWDNYYIENWSFWLDFKIAVLTVLAVLRDRSE